MRILNGLIIFLTVFSSCIYTGKVQSEVEQINDEFSFAKDLNPRIHGDTIFVDTVIGDFHLTYKVSSGGDVVMSCQNSGNDLLGETYKEGKTILLNIEKIDSTSITSYNRISVADFDALVPDDEKGCYLIEEFYLKEVRRNSIIFEAKLCMSDNTICLVAEVVIEQNGAIIYRKSEE